jgi:glutathione S-transferase
MKLYYTPQTRATRARWALEELGVPYDLVRIDLAKGEQRSDAYKKIHPHGKVPALVDGDRVVIESIAIAAYVADKHIDKGLAPPLASPDRATYLKWLFYAAATIEAPLGLVSLHTKRLPEDQRNPAVVDIAKGDFKGVVAYLGGELEAKSFLVGDRLTAADVIVGSMMMWGRSMGLVEHPAVVAYCDRLRSRPAYQRATAD